MFDQRYHQANGSRIDLLLSILVVLQQKFGGGGGGEMELDVENVIQPNS
jgi:hypothetical protein